MSKELLPRSDSNEARDAIEKVFAERDWPVNPNAAARCGWEAARRYDANLQAAKPADPVPQPLQVDSLGSLPVVAWRLVDVDDGSEMLLSWRPTFHEGSGDTLIPLTDHAQATAEIARLQREVDELRQVWQSTSSYNAELILDVATLRTQLSDTTGQVGKLREALSFYADSHRYEGLNQRALVKDKFTPDNMPYRMDVTRDGGEIACAALNSTAQESAE